MARIFLCHASEDKAQVHEVYRRLRTIDGFEPWLDEENLLPGQEWAREIPRAIHSSDFILIFFSRTSVAKRGYFQREMKLALDAWQEVPEGTIHTIPVRIDDCDVPESCRRYQWVNLFDPNGFDRIVRAMLTERAKRQGKEEGERQRVLAPVRGAARRSAHGKEEGERQQRVLKQVPTDPKWLLHETEFWRSALHAREAVFTIGNGYLCTRGTFEEGLIGDLPATLIHGVFDDAPLVGTELANAPDWLPLALLIGGEHVQLDTGVLLHYERVLYLRNGVLTRAFRWQSSTGQTVDIRYERFMSLADKNVLIVRCQITPIDFSGPITLLVTLDGNMGNLGVTACNRNRLGLQSAYFPDHIRCLYYPTPDHIICL